MNVCVFSKKTLNRLLRESRIFLSVTVCLLFSGLAGCGYYDARTAHKAQISVIGISSSDLQSCMGIPDKTAKLPDGTELYQYTRTTNIPSANDSTLFPLQSVVNITENALGGAGKTCLAFVRIANGKVVDLHYGGDDDEIVGADGVCATVARGCTRRPLPSMQPVSSSPLGPVWAYRQPQMKRVNATVPVAAPQTQPAENSAVTTPPAKAMDATPVIPANLSPDLRAKAVTTSGNAP